MRDREIKYQLKSLKKIKRPFGNLLLFYLFQILSERVENVYRAREKIEREERICFSDSQNLL